MGLLTRSDPGGADLWLPGQDVDREEFDYGEASSDVELVAWFRRELKQIDERFDIIWAKPNAASFPTPGRFYIVRKNDGPHPPSMWMIDDGKGGYDTPKQADLDKLQKLDTTNNLSWHKYRERKESERRRAEHRKSFKREERDGLALELLSHHMDTTISVPGLPESMGG